jgi:hypothetical protein
LFNLFGGLPDTFRYENHVIVAERDYVIAHRRFSGHGRPAAWIAADVVRVEDGKLAEHWVFFRGRRPKRNPSAVSRSAIVSRPEGMRRGVHQKFHGVFPQPFWKCHHTF